ncbi:hypothetical protein GCM10008090_33540 [Arenicella chitinivorans]|uniref:DUF2946 domain-containing protein n=1 Tax=Arenicella chitinivorans TaxID=1329800 RepID=A0A918VT72_9GAMM|nr:DUF2946 family protein [Arenicella chitinivorans]GHA20903.1 hypothetical protein GCM10008090_33540 [Arenicella chitinivorans]
MLAHITDRTRKSQRNSRWIAQWLVLLMLVNTLAAATQSSTPTQVLLCTSQGYQWVSIEEQGSSESKQSVYHCAFCLFNTDVDLPIVNSVSDWSGPILAHQFLRQPNAHHLLSTDRVYRHPNRAPPYTC